jgi:hypothetical protein
VHSNARDMASEIRLLQISCSIVSEILERARYRDDGLRSIFHNQFFAHPGAPSGHPAPVRGRK